MTRPHGVYTSGEAVNLALQAVEEREAAIIDGKAVSGLFGIREIDDYVVPLWPGDLCYVTALPSNGKSFAARMFMKRVVDALILYGDSNRVAVWITTEESIEKVTTHWLAAMSGVSSTAMLSGKLSPPQKITMNASVAEVGSWPLYIVGHSVAHRDEDGIQAKTARLGRDEIDACLDYIMNTAQKDIVFTTLDYIHRVRNESTSDREEHVRKTVDWTRDVAIWTSSPFVVAAQAKQKVSERRNAMPGLTDVEWSMNAGQSADTVFGLWMPKTTLGVGHILDEFGEYRNVLINETMLFVGIGKQKDGRGGKVFLLDVKPHLMTWEPLVVDTVNFNEPADRSEPVMSNEGSANNWPTAQQENIPF
jgi:replicative DNA helicase